MLWIGLLQLVVVPPENPGPICQFIEAIVLPVPSVRATPGGSMSTLASTASVLALLPCPGCGPRLVGGGGMTGQSMEPVVAPTTVTRPCSSTAMAPLGARSPNIACGSWSHMVTSGPWSLPGASIPWPVAARVCERMACSRFASSRMLVT